MKRSLIYKSLGCMFAALLAALAGFRSSPALARAWSRAVALPALSSLNRLTGRTDRAVLECAALGIAGIALLGLLAALPRGLPALRRWFRAMLAAALVVAILPALLWYPLYWAEGDEAVPTPNPAKLEALCEALAQALDASPIDFPSIDWTLPRAGTVAGLPGARVKLARYPIAMRALHLAGLFSPWTGEVMLDGGAPEALIPFTAVHELMHLSGIADEGAANIAAWTRCRDAGWAFAASARLWALRYALGELSTLDPAAFRRAAARLPAGIARLCAPIRVDPGGSALSRLVGVGDKSSSYPALAAWLCDHPEAL